MRHRIVIIAERDFAEVSDKTIERHIEGLRGIVEDSAHVVCEEIAHALLAEYDALSRYIRYLLAQFDSAEKRGAE